MESAFSCYHTHKTDSCMLTYAKELSIARPSEMNTHLGTPKILG
jgi:hypothetical protein